MSFLHRLVAFSVLALTLAAPAAAARLALVIGNDSYAHVEKLRNARADARALAKVLETAGFTVSLLLDQDRAGMQAGLRRFKSTLTGGDEAVFFYAGHGVELGGINYLLPTDIRDDNDDQLQDDAVPLQRVLGLLLEQKPRFSLVIIDACRDDPFRGKGRNVGTRGLVPTTVANGQMVIYSAGAGQRALDRLGDSDSSPNGVFTRVLVREIERGGVPVHEVVRSVRQQVARLAGSVGHEQVPAFYDQAIGDFYFKRGEQGAPDTGKKGTGEGAFEQDLWRDASRLDTMEAYDAYLDAYPAGRFSPMARAAKKKLETLKGQAPQSTSRDEFPAGRVFRDCADCPDVVVIPGGSFEMGSPPKEDGHTSSEEPVHLVRVGRFGMGMTEITRGQFRRFVKASGHVAAKGCSVYAAKAWKVDAARSWESPGYEQTDDHPVACVNRDDAQAYVTWLSRTTGKDYRLPGEAEWEYAARAGTRGARYWGDGDADACRYANVSDAAAKRKGSAWTAFSCDDGFAETAPVGSFPGNAFGLRDMLGNIGELTQDCYVDTYAAAPTDGSAVSQAGCGGYAVRGGTWRDFFPSFTRSAFRSKVASTDRSYYLGFRVARTLPR